MTLPLSIEVELRSMAPQMFCKLHHQVTACCERSCNSTILAGRSFNPQGLTSSHKFPTKCDHGKTCDVHFLALFLELSHSHCNCIVNLPYVSVTFQAMQLSVSDKNLRMRISGRKYRPVEAPAARQTCPSRVSLAPEATVLVALVRRTLE